MRSTTEEIQKFNRTQPLTSGAVVRAVDRALVIAMSAANNKISVTNGGIKRGCIMETLLCSLVSNYPRQSVDRPASEQERVLLPEQQLEDLSGQENICDHIGDNWLHGRRAAQDNSAPSPHGSCRRHSQKKAGLPIGAVHPHLRSAYRDMNFISPEEGGGSMRNSYSWPASQGGG